MSFGGGWGGGSFDASNLGGLAIDRSNHPVPIREGSPRSWFCQRRLPPSRVSQSFFRRWSSSNMRVPFTTTHSTSGENDFKERVNFSRFNTESVVRSYVGVLQQQEQQPPPPSPPPPPRPPRQQACSTSSSPSWGGGPGTRTTRSSPASSWPASRRPT